MTSVHNLTAEFKEKKIDPNGSWIEAVSIHLPNVPMISRTQCINATYSHGQSRSAKPVLSSLLELAKTLPDWCHTSPLRVVDSSRVSGVM